MKCQLADRIISGNRMSLVFKFHLDLLNITSSLMSYSLSSIETLFFLEILLCYHLLTDVKAVL